MVKANELRIGNKIKVYNDVATVDGVDSTTIYTTGYFDDERLLGNCDCSFETAQPIPLTPEILEKCGFQLAPQRISIYEKGLLRLWLGHTGCIAYLINKDTRESHYIRDIQHLHQLQNVYYALTGEELSIYL